MSERKPHSSHAVEDLSVLSRRGALSSAEQQACLDVLDADAALATAHQVGLDFDRIAAVEPGDDALIAEVAARVVSRGRISDRSGSRLRLRALLLAATLTLAGSAAAWWQHTQAPVASTSQQQAAPSHDAPGEVRAPHVTAARATTSEPSARAEPPPLPSVEKTASSRAAPSSTRSSATAGGAFDSAELLFREANSARRAGNAPIARALYLRLEHDFPASDEAHLAHVSLGKLLLSMGRAAEAEQQFASYLGGRPALAQEALVGRAESLAALGQSAEERRVWEGLLRDYPSSVYAARARLRLTELAAAAAARH